jgi:hypothetical protein
MEKFREEMFDYCVFRDGKRVKLSMLKLEVDDEEYKPEDCIKEGCINEDCINEDCINELNKSFVVNFD